jgi:cytoskeletal protein CcmA (bactofilin family)
MARAETTVIGRSSHIRGRITGATDLAIEGLVEGEIELAGDVTIDVHGRVAANVSAQRLVVRGAIKGDLTASEAVVLEDGAKVVGDVRAPRITIAPGALLRGYVQTAHAGSAPPRAKAQPAPAVRPVPAAVPAAAPRAHAAPVPARVQAPPPARVAAPVAPPPAPSKAKGPPAPMVPVLKKGAKGTLQKKRA